MSEESTSNNNVSSNDDKSISSTSDMRNGSATTTTTTLSSPRIELFFSSPDQLRQRVHLLSSHGYTKFNLVNKNVQDTLVEWSAIIKEECPTADVCAHYSLKYNKVARKGTEAHVDLLQDFVRRAAAAAKETSHVLINEVLIVSGGHNLSKARPKWNTVEALHNYKIPDKDAPPLLAVAYNPYIPDESKQQEETQRLQAKLETGLVQKVYLQFGTDLVKLKQALEWLTCSYQNITIAGSLFLPTKQLLAQQKFRPWNGVYLSREFLGTPNTASEIVVELMKLYATFGVEALWEAPGVRTEKDLQLIRELTEQAAASSSSEEETTTVAEQNMDGLVHAGKEFCDGTTHVEESVFNNDKEDTKEEEDSKPAVAKVNGSPEPKRQKTLPQKTLPETSSATSSQLPPSSSTCILLFGPHDLRLYDNLAVQAACQDHSIVVPVFLWSPLAIESGSGMRAEALEVVIQNALDNLAQELQSFGLQLICRSCPTAAAVKRQLASLLEETSATAIHYNRDFTPQGRKLEEVRKQVVEEKFKSCALLKPHQSVLLYDIDQVDLKKGFHGGHWGTLMPFYNNCKRNYGLPRRPIPTHETFSLLQKVKGPETWPASHRSTLPLAVLPLKVKPWHQPIRDAFPRMSHKGAQQDLEAFFSSQNSGFRRYDKERSRADKERSTSRLSAHLRVGTLSPNELYWRHEDHPIDNGVFSRRLIWRDLAYYQLRCFPQMSTLSIRSHYEKTSWVTGEEAERRLKAWKLGLTGYPIVDAGMRELWATGWMNQSVRMVVASFLVDYLRVHWVKGCEWFHYTLVDADSAINAMMWQNAAKAGIDQWNFMLSPESGSQDPTGLYVKKWVPELSKLSLQSGIHRPWETPQSLLEQYGISLGGNYPHRVVTGLKEERAKSVESIVNMRRNAQEHNDKRGYDLIKLPNGEKTVVYTLKEFRIDRGGKVLPSQRREKRATRRPRKGKR